MDHKAESVLGGNRSMADFVMDGVETLVAPVCPRESEYGPRSRSMKLPGTTLHHCESLYPDELQFERKLFILHANIRNGSWAKRTHPLGASESFRPNESPT